MKNDYGQEPKPVNFGDSIRICFKKYAVFDGRASRSELWYFKLFWWIIAILTLLLPWTVGNIIWIIFGLGAMIPMISVNCRRLHDINKSGWFQLIPIVNLIMWVQESSSDSSTGSKPTRERSTKSYNFDNNQSSSSNDLIDELEELKMLYEDGTLSETQFKKAKKKLLK
tara:strand:+ start:108 stop:614 length:507 start_codon:yes stop_codon:yes gene_type:complete